MSHLENARSLIETNFPQEVLSVLDLNTLQIEPGSSMDSALRGKQSDLLLSAAMVDAPKASSKSGKRVYVYFLFEHKSHSDPLTVLQVLS
jgi:predicted transposase YdaD